MEGERYQLPCGVSFKARARLNLPCTVIDCTVADCSGSRGQSVAARRRCGVLDGAAYISRSQRERGSVVRAREGEGG